MKTVIIAIREPKFFMEYIENLLHKLIPCIREFKDYGLIPGVLGISIDKNRNTYCHFPVKTYITKRQVPLAL